MPSDRNWAHRTEFDPVALAEFERRLGRATTAKRPSYLRVKAATLLEQGDPAALPIVIALLQRVVTDYDHFLEVPLSHELLGGAFRRAGDLSQAAVHLKLAIQTADQRRNGLSLPELELAEILIEAGNRDEAAIQLRAVEDLEYGVAWNSQLYRHALAKARVEFQTGGDPAPWAERALELAANTEPQLPRHPTVELIEASPDELGEMRRLANPKGRRRRWGRA